jgi:anti-sigma B factor antagonist
MELKIKTERKAPGVYSLLLNGWLDTQTYEKLDKKVEEILKESPKTIIFNMEQLDYISSAGVRVIYKTQKAIKRTDGNILFMNLKPQIKKVFEIINALPSMNVFSSVEELDEYLDAMQQKAIKEKTE